MTKHEAWGAIAWMLAAIITAFVLLFAFLSFAMADETLPENPISADCVPMIPKTSAHQCSPNRTQPGSIEIPHHYGVGGVDSPIQRCEMLRVWKDESGNCQWCRTSGCDT